MIDEEYQLLQTKVLKLTGIDLDSYKSLQMRRRLAFIIEKTNGLDVAAYCGKIEADRDCPGKLRDFITINVTEFFRDAKNKLNQQIRSSLNNSGVLFTGSTEFIHNATAIGFKKLSNCFYQKAAVPVSVNQPLKEPLLQTVRR